MAIYDNDGTTKHEIGKLYDADSTTKYQIGEVYDHIGTTKSLIYKAELVLLNGPENNMSKYNGNFNITYANSSGIHTGWRGDDWGTQTAGWASNDKSIDLSQYTKIKVRGHYFYGAARCGAYVYLHDTTGRTIGSWTIFYRNGGVGDDSFTFTPTIDISGFTGRGFVEVQSIHGQYYSGSTVEWYSVILE